MLDSYFRLFGEETAEPDYDQGEAGQREAREAEWERQQERDAYTWRDPYDDADPRP